MAAGPDAPEPDAPEPDAAASGPGPGPRPTAPEGANRWRLLLAYDGSGFRGFAAQPGTVTVAGTLAAALARAARLDDPPPIVCAGRTDAGVHARGQVVHVDLPADLHLDLVHVLNRQLAPAIVVRSAVVAAPDFDARRDATGRHYRYLVWNAPVPDPLLAPVAWHVPDPLDLRAMSAAADALIGQHDFRAFCRRPPGTTPEDPIVRVVTDARWSAVGHDAADLPVGSGRLLRFDIGASSFCHQMVRSVVATLVDAGRGRGNTATVVGLLAAGSRAGTARPAPAHGLCLVAVDYPAC
ncbi:MAG TPA: tRNA pseudouridine(38-40) synthase TruA [Acidimicrobiales bacterium]|nr:tRNA pseudouridine(38-40) synthase TruA [Acidimicrobiales bacterium]